MQQDRKMGVLLALPLAGLLGLAGCSSVIPANLEHKLTSKGSADEHMAAAMLYQNKAEQYEAKAEQFEKKASGIAVLEDPKGFRRQALEIAAEENRNKAQRMEELYAAHVEKAQTMYGKTSPE